MGTASPEQIDSLTSLRGLLALWVVFYHFWNDVLALFPSLDALTPIMIRGDFAVPGFFVLSGFVLTRKYAPWFERKEARPVFDFLALRLARIYPVHAATLLCVAVMVAVSHRLGFVLSSTGYSAKDFLLNVFLVHAWTPHLELTWNYPSWSISSEWFAYLLFPVLIRSLRPTLRTTRVALLAFFVASLLSIAVLFSWSPLPFRELAVVTPTFLAGMAVGKIAILRSSETGGVPRWLPAFCTASMLGACYAWGFIGMAVLLIALYVLVLSLALLGNQSRFAAIPALLLLGDVSYSLYMTHTLAQKVLTRVLPAAAFGGRPTLVRLAVLAAYALAIVLVCAATYVVIERPSRRWGRRRVERAQETVRASWSTSGLSG